MEMPRGHLYKLTFQKVIHHCMHGRPPEAEEPPGTAWLLHKALPGLKGSAQIWGGHTSETLCREQGLKQSKLDECLFFGEGIVLMRHMDDFVAVGEKKKVKALLDSLRASLMVTGTELLTEVGQKIQILGRVLKKTKQGYAIACPPKLLAKAIEADGAHDWKGSKAPGREDKGAAG